MPECIVRKVERVDDTGHVMVHVVFRMTYEFDVILCDGVFIPLQCAVYGTDGVVDEV